MADEGSGVAETPEHGVVAAGPTRNVPAVWRGVEELRPVAVNAFHLTVTPLRSGQPGEMVLAFGFLAPPLLTGTAEEQLVQAQKIDEVAIDAVGRVAFSVERALELQELLHRVLTALGK